LFASRDFDAPGAATVTTPALLSAVAGINEVLAGKPIHADSQARLAVAHMGSSHRRRRTPNVGFCGLGTIQKLAA
jgi:hypothetical protein